MANQVNPPLIDTAKEITVNEKRLNEYVDDRVKLNRKLFPLNATPEEQEEHDPKNYAELSGFVSASLGDRAIVSPKAIARRENELVRFKRDINLVNFAIAQGFAKIPKESSAKSIKLKHPNGSKIVVKPGDEDVYFSPDESLGSGTVIDLVQHLQQVNLGQARKILRDYLGEQKPTNSRKGKERSTRSQLKSMLKFAQAVPPQQKVKEKQKAKLQLNLKRLKRHQYLEVQRKIHQRTIGSDRFSGQIQIDDCNNATFPYRDNQGITGYELRNFDFKGFGAGGSKSLWRSNQKDDDDKLVIVESPIDALSYHQLNPDRRSRYIATGGTMSAQQRQLLKVQIKLLTDNMKTIIIATDNDKAGDKLASEIKGLLPSKSYLFQSRERAKNKDWNEDLIAHQNQSQQNHDRQNYDRQKQGNEGFSI